MALIKNISPLHVVIMGGGSYGTALVTHALHLQGLYPSKLKLCGVVVPPDEKTIAAGLAHEAGVPLWRKAVDAPEFASTLANTWQPEIIYSAGYVAPLPPHLADLPRLGAYNIHPCTDGAWPPTYTGADSLAAMLAAHEPVGILALHHADSGDDTGELVAISKSFPLDEADTPETIARKTAEIAAWMMEAHLGKYLGLPQRDFLEWGYSEVSHRAVGA